VRNATTKDVAKALGVSDRSVRSYARAGLIPFTTTPGGHRRYDIDEVRAALGGPRRSDAPTLEMVRRHARSIRRIAAEHGASDVRIFGSVAAGTARADSDVDLLVSLERGRSFADLDDLEDELARLLGHPVDVITDGAVHGRLAGLSEAAVQL
jgi:excisionase family DNA binding protein